MIIFFGEWIKDGFTDFTAVDLSFKTQLDLQTDEEIDGAFKGIILISSQNLKAILQPYF